MNGATGPDKGLLTPPFITIDEPQPFKLITRVKCPGGSGPTGVICAHGTVSNLQGAILTAVFGKVINLATAFSQTHDADATRGDVNVTVAGSWQFIGPGKEVPVIPAACPQATPTADNAQFVVWCVLALGTGTLEFGKSTTFAGVASTQTECEGSGYPGGSGDDRGRRTGAAVVRTGVETAPRQVQVVGKGFRGSAAGFNARWLLSLRCDGGRACLWDNGGDGVQQPRIELRCDGVVATEWRLTLAHAGLRVYYTCPANEWRPLAANQLKAAGRARAEGLPETLVVSPV